MCGTGKDADGTRHDGSRILLPGTIIGKQLLFPLRSYCLQDWCYAVKVMNIAVCNEGHWCVFEIYTVPDGLSNSKFLSLRVSWGDPFFNRPSPRVNKKLCEVLGGAFPVATMESAIEAKSWMETGDLEFCM